MRNLDQKQIALRNLKAYIETLRTLLIKEKEGFDLIAGSGNTGAFMLYLAERIYFQLNIKFPPTLVLPILRYKGDDHPENLFDNSVLYPEAKKRLKGVYLLDKVLFVDDEIYAGHGVKETMKLIQRYKLEYQLNGETTCTIVAEDQGISSNFSIPGVKTELRLFAKGYDEVPNAITYYLPDDITKPISEVMGDKMSSHTVPNILFKLPYRSKRDTPEIPEFTFKYNQLAKEKINNFDELSEKAKIYTDEMIKSILNGISS